MMKRITMIVLGIALVLGTGAFKQARMALSAELKASTQPIDFSGIGGRRKGEYTVGDYRGTFKRSASRRILFDVVGRRAGETHFTLKGPAIDSELKADCVMRERTITLGDFEFTPKKMAYGCSFRSGDRLLPAAFELQEVREGLGGALMKWERRGQVAVGDVTLSIRSVHKFEGSPLPSSMPAGYVFSRNGIDVAGIELTGRPRLFLPRAEDAALHRAVLAGAVTLALFWDPADDDN